VAAAIVPDSDLTLTGVGVNPTRTGLLDVLREMGADVTLENQTYYGAEPVADIRVRYSPLRGVRISGETVVRMIDEFPIFAVAAACADSPSVVTEAKELRMKESDRIAAIVQELGKLGAEVREWEDGFEVTGKARLRGAEVFSRGDHRIAMSLTIAALTASGETLVQGTAPIATSFPGFFERLAQVAPGSGEVVS
jgi:3-phosphoshikimate 1-carboxyvinyltransferase